VPVFFYLTDGHMMNRIRDIFAIIGIFVLVIGAAVALFIPYVPIRPYQQLDTLLPIDSTHSMLFAYGDDREQWQIEPVPLFRMGNMMPHSFYINSQIVKQGRIFMITRRQKQANTINVTQEYYVRHADGDYLIGIVDATGMTLVQPALLIRPNNRTPHTWHNTDNTQIGVVSGTLGYEGDCQVTTITAPQWRTWQEVFCYDNLTKQQRGSSPQHLFTRIAGDTPINTEATTPTNTQPRTISDWQHTRLGKLQPINIGESLIGNPSYSATPNQVIIAMTGGYVMAMDMRDGHEAWRYAVAGEAYSNPTYNPYHGGIVFGTTHKMAVAINETGLMRWEQSLANAAVADPCPTPAGIVFADSGGRVSLLDANDGHEIWHVNSANYVSATPVYDPHNKQIIVASQTGVLTAYTLTGQQRWQTGSDQTIVADLVLDQNAVYTVAFDGTVSAYQLSTGQLQWQLAVLANGDWPITSHEATLAVATSNDVVLIDSQRGEIVHRIVATSNAPPRFSDAGLLITTRDRIQLYTTQGQAQAMWDIRSLDTISDSNAHQIDLRTMPIITATTIVWASTKGQIIALQPPPVSTPLVQRWYQIVTKPPINSQSFTQRTLDSNNQLVTLHIDRTMSRFAPTSGDIIDRQQIGMTSTMPLAFATDTNYFYIADTNSLNAYNLQGKPQWQIATPGAFLHFIIPYPSMLLHFFQDELINGHLRAIDRVDGRVLWEQTTHALTYADDIVFDDQHVFVAGVESYAITDGTLQWQQPEVLQHLTLRDTEICGIRPRTTGSQIHCLAHSDGRPSTQSDWQSAFDSLHAVPNSPNLVATTSSDIRALNPQTQQIIWQIPLTTALADVPVITATHGYLLFMDGRLLEFAVGNGQITRWIRDLPINYAVESNLGRPRRLLLADDTLYVVSSLHAIAVDITQ
jgi:outer membrane protein assembly factor BamB